MTEPVRPWIRLAQCWEHPRQSEAVGAVLRLYGSLLRREAARFHGPLSPGEAASAAAVGLYAGILAYDLSQPSPSLAAITYHLTKYVRQAVRNEARREMAYYRRHLPPPMAADGAHDILENDWRCQVPGAEEEALGGTYSPLLEMALGQLTARERLIVNACVHDGQSFTAAAAVLGISRQAVSRTYHGAIKKLQSLMPKPPGQHR